MHSINRDLILLLAGLCFTGACYEGHSQVTAARTMPDEKIWMTSNLNIDIPGSYCYNNTAQKCKQYGRLYTWQSAQEGCRLAGEGWRLPTNIEWQQLAKQYGGVRDDSPDSGRAAFKALVFDKDVSFNAALGGGRDVDGSYARLNGHGFYWTATESDTGTAWFYNFGSGGKMLNRHHDGEKQSAFSVRCIKDTKTP